MWICLCVFCSTVFAQQVEITQNTYQKVSVSFTPGSLTVMDISVPEGVFSLISMPDYGVSYNPGAPQLPQLSKMLQIPVCDSVIATVVDAQFVEYDAADLGVNHPLFPSQPSLPKNAVSQTFAYNQAVYSTNDYYSLPLVKVEKAGIRRNVAMANVYVSPVQYNPVSQKIRVYTHIEVSFTFANVDMAHTNALKNFASPMFSLDDNMLINKMQGDRDEISALPVKYLIIGNSMFASNEDLAEFVAWKRRLGYLVEVAYTSDASVGTTTTSIKNFIQNKYNNPTAEDPAPTYLLLLGDREQLPAFNSQVSGNNHITDLYYATLAGNDFLPDCYYGRLSATNNADLSHQIEKIMMYEQYSMPDPSYLGNAVLIAGTDGNFGPTHANGQVNYIVDNYINNNNPRYTNVMAHMYDCSSQAAQIREEVSVGAGWVNYTAHGSETSWADPEFNTSQVAQLQNTDKYGVMIGNCCQSGNFKTGECFGEALLRAEKKGAMAYIGASNNSYWGEDFYWAVGVRSNINANPVYMANALGMYDKLFHTHDEAHDCWVSTIAGIMTTGNLTVQSSSSSRKQYYWEIYHCFGDPSVRAYLGIPSEMEVNANSVISNNMTSYQVQAEAPYAYVALTQGETLIAAAFADDEGVATLSFPSTLAPGEYECVVLAQNYIPYFQDVQVVSLTGPYVIPTTMEVAENTCFNEGNTINMNLSLANVGISNASNVYATLVPEGTVTMLQDSVFVGSINVDDASDLNNAFSFVMPASEDYSVLSFTLFIHWNNTVTSREVRVRVKLPKVVMQDYTTSVSSSQTDFLRPGDEVVFSFQNRNVGHATVSSGSLDLTCNYSGVTVLTNPIGINGLTPNTDLEQAFIIAIADTVPNNSIVPLYYHVEYEGIHTVDTLYVKVGGDLETFESGDFSQHAWSMNDYSWEVITNNAYSGQYCARSMQGLPDSQKSQMSVTINVQEAATLSYYRRVSSEKNWDKFILYVDGVAKDEASGKLGWVRVDIEVPAGTHTLKFSYEKDDSQNDGSDCAWIDNVLFPSVGIMVIEDLTDTTVVGVQDIEVVRARVFPNPTNEYVVIESETPVQQAVLFDLNGRAVKSVNLAGENRSQLHLGDLPSGFYMLQLTLDNQHVQTLKIIKR